MASITTRSHAVLRETVVDCIRIKDLLLERLFARRNQEYVLCFIYPADDIKKQRLLLNQNNQRDQLDFPLWVVDLRAKHLSAAEYNAIYRMRQIC